MKTLHFLSFFLTSYLLIPFALSKQKIIIATSGTFSPANISKESECLRLKRSMTKTNNGHKICGFEIEIANEICKIEKIDCHWTIQNFGAKLDNKLLPQILDELTQDNPRYDIVATFARGTVERMKLLNASVTWYEGNSSIYGSPSIQSEIDMGHIIKKENNFPFFKNPKDTKLRFGTLGFHYEELKTRYTEDELQHIEIFAIPNIEEQIRKIQENELDFIYSLDVQKSLFESYGILTYDENPGRTIAQPIEHGPRFYAAPTVQGVDLIGRFNNGIAKLKTDGRLDQILEKYRLKNKWACDNGPRLKQFTSECENK